MEGQYNKEKPTDQELTPPISSSNSTVKTKHVHIFIFGYLALIIFVAAVAGIYSWQHHKVENLNGKVTSLQAQVLKANSVNVKTQKQQVATSHSTFKYEPQHSGLSLTLPKTYGILVECDGNCGGALGVQFRVVPYSGTNISTDWGYYDEASFNAEPNFSSLSQSVKADEEQTMESDNCGPQKGGCDISDFSLSDTTVAGLPAELIKSNGVNENLGNVNVYVVGLGQWEYDVTVNNITSGSVTNGLVTTILKGITIKQATGE